MEYVIAAAILLEGLALAYGAWFYDRRARQRLQNTANRLYDRLGTDYDDVKREVRDQVESLRPTAEIWGVSVRYEAIVRDEVPATGSDFLRPSETRVVPLGTYLAVKPGTETVDLILRPPWPGRLTRVQVFGGPWLLNRICVGNKVVSWCDGLNTAVGTETQMMEIDALYMPGNEIAIRLDRPRGLP